MINVLELWLTVLIVPLSVILRHFSWRLSTISSHISFSVATPRCADSCWSRGPALSDAVWGRHSLFHRGCQERRGRWGIRSYKGFLQKSPKASQTQKANSDGGGLRGGCRCQVCPPTQFFCLHLNELTEAADFGSSWRKYRNKQKAHRL